VDLRIDGTAVEFELERERNLGDVLYSLDKWLDGHGLIISRVDIDGDSIGDDILKVKDRQLDSINCLDIRTERLSSFRQKTLAAACAWLDGILDWASASGKDSREELVKEGLCILSSASGFLNPEEVSFLEMAQEVIKNSSDGRAEATIGRIAPIIRERLEECVSPRSSLGKAAAAFRRERESILNIPVWLQTGRDSEAMAAVTGFTETFSKILRLMPTLSESGLDASQLLIDGKPYADFFSDLNKVLNELMEAFGSRDTVLIGDLAEYEVLPRLDSIFEALEKAAT
jgi:hypothetical protein